MISFYYYNTWEVRIKLFRFLRTFSTFRDFSLLLSPKPATYSGELRNGSSLHVGFYDLILFFPVSSFILILDGCV